MADRSRNAYRQGGSLMRQPATGMPPRVSSVGQSTIEYAVLLAAVVAAIVVMGDYVRRAMNAHGNSVEEQMNGAVVDNSPGLTGLP